MNILEKSLNDPSGAKLYKLAHMVEIPRFVGEADLEDKNFESLPKEAFAYPAKRMYPLNNKANTWLSREMFKMDKEAFDKSIASYIESRIEKAADLWEVSEPRKLAPPVKKSYKVSVHHGDKEAMSLSLSEPHHYKEAAEHLYNNKDKYTFEMRNSFSRALLGAPDEFKCEVRPEVSEYLEKAAGFGMTLPSRVNKSIADRVSLVRVEHPELSDRLVKLSHEVDLDSLNPSILIKVASAIDMVDRAIDLHRFYGKGFNSPEEDLFYITEKKAQEFLEEIVPLTNGSNLSVTKLINKKGSIDQFMENYFGEIPYESDRDMIDVVMSLPSGDASALERSLNE